MRSVVVTGAAGFAGYHLTKRLSESGYRVHAVVRPNSEHNRRLDVLPGVLVIECDMSEYHLLATRIGASIDFFFHMAWYGGRYDFDAQIRNQNATLLAVDEAAKLGCKRFIAAGSQAEYGVVSDLTTEDTPPNPFSEYGAVKVATCYLSKIKAHRLKLDWIWGRIFSLYGRYEPVTHMLPYLISELKKDHDIALSSCRQNWDYLYASDAADAFVALGEYGRDGEIYNIANGDFRPLKEYVESAISYYQSKSIISYGDDPQPFVSLQPSIQKIKLDTGWAPKVSFEESLELLQDFSYGNE